ncbi:MAG: DNA photolyase [Desulfobacterales bacterium]|nr:DNA photolyase [Desulfobacterales bacterium]
MTALTEVYVDPSVEASPVVQRIRQGLNHLPWHVRADLDHVIQEVVSYHADPCGAGKRILLIRPFPGRLVKACPGTAGHICCGYKTINVLTNCPMDCSYCILQGYLNNPCVTLYPDFAKVFREIERLLTLHPHRVFRFGTGELGDSLALDKICGFADAAVPFFAAKANAILELKTKSVEVDHLLALDHRGRTVISWSLNPPQVIEQEEHGAASLAARLEAARRCSDAGYHIGFHFDPLISYPGWEDDYHRVVDLLFERIDPSWVLWVSLGGLRFPPALKQVAQGRFPFSRIFTGELIPGEDGKLRYIKPVRVQMYQRMVEWLQAYDEKLFIYLCMERGDVWHEVFNSTPGSTQGLNRRFEQRVTCFLEDVQ